MDFLLAMLLHQLGGNTLEHSKFFAQGKTIPCQSFSYVLLCEHDSLKRSLDSIKYQKLYDLKILALNLILQKDLVFIDNISNFIVVY